MSRILIICLIFITSIPMIYSQETEVPENPAFIKWQEKKRDAQQNSGEIPALVLSNHEWILNESQKKATSFEASYDLRAFNLVTGAKNQGSCGACWTFGTMGSLESALLKQGFGSFDLSEQNLRTCHDFILGENLSCSGGNNRKATAYLTRGDGPVLENSIPYNTDNEAVCDLYSNPQFNVFEINYFPNDAQILKQALLDFGALYTNMYYDDDFYSKSLNTYYYNGEESIDHAVLLVGWDDDKTTQAGKGAWIIKNSWGEDWGDEGFFYIAYQDTKINSSAASFQGIESKKEETIIHMYDKLGWISSLGYGNGFAKGLVKFTTSEAQTLTSVGTYATASGAVIRATIYKEKSGDFLINSLGETENTYFTFSGFHRIDLIEPIHLEANQDFYVEVEYSTNTYNYPIPFEKAKADYADPEIEKNVGWISSSGISWYPIGNDIEGKERDLSIRVYAKNSANATTEIEELSKTIQLFPQPANKILTIKLDVQYLNQQLLIVDLNGQLINKSIIQSTTKTIDLHNFTAGIYMVRIENSNNNLLVQKRFLKVD